MTTRLFAIVILATVAISMVFGNRDQLFDDRLLVRHPHFDRVGALRWPNLPWTPIAVGNWSVEAFMRVVTVGAR
jgi:hypothetical protein